MVIISQLERIPFDHQIRYRMLNRTKREDPPVAGTTGGHLCTMEYSFHFLLIKLYHTLSTFQV